MDILSKLIKFTKAERFIKVSCLLLIISLLFTIVSCGNKSSINNDNRKNTLDIPNSVKLKVVYIPQNDMKSCATTSIAMAISYYENLNDKPLDKETVWKISGSNEDTVYKYGNDMEGLKNIANHYGYKSKYAENMEINDIEYLLSKGILVILNIKVNKNSSATHAILVIGYDKNKKILYVNDPANEQNKIFKYSDLKSRWSAHLSSPKGESYRSGFIIYPKNRENEKY